MVSKPKQETKKLRRRISEFKQLQQVKLYADLTTFKRKEVTNDSGKRFFNFMNYSVGGKTIEDLR